MWAPGRYARANGKMPTAFPIFWATAALLRALAAPPAEAAAPREEKRLTVRLRVQVAACSGADGGGDRASVRSPAWVDEHVEAARALLAPHGIDLTATQQTFSPARCDLLGRADRNALARQVTMDGTVTVLVLARVRDLDVPTYDLMGVHWRAQGKRWIILTARARPPVLAHELGHFFGLPHDPAGGNLMTPGPSSPLWKSSTPPRPFAPVLTPEQAARLRAGIEAAAKLRRRRRSSDGRH
jgi:hypothetical protein